MSAVVNGAFHLHETWIIAGTVRDWQAQPVDMTGSDVRLRMAHSNGAIMMDLSVSGGDGTLTNASRGQYEFIITSDDQDAKSMSPGAYRYEVRAEFIDGQKSVQNTGTIRVIPSLFGSDD